MLQPLQRILVVRTDRLGDVVLTLPVLSLLRSCYPQAHLSMLLRRYTGEIVEGNIYVNSLLWYDDPDGPLPFRTLLRIVRRERFDAAIVARPTLRLALLVFLAGIPLRVGTGYRAYSILFNRRVFEHRRTAARHELEYNLNLLAAVGCQVPQFPCSPDYGLRVSSRTEAQVRTLLAERGVADRGRRVIVHPGSGGSAREWPEDNLRELASRLHEKEGCTVLVTGSRQEKARVDLFAASVRGGATGLAGLCTVPELAALVRSADLFVSNSTGPLHVAAAVGTPVLGFYPHIVPMSAARWGPYGTASRVLVSEGPVDCDTCVRKRMHICDCMARISVEVAFEKAKELLTVTARKELEGAH